MCCEHVNPIVILGPAVPLTSASNLRLKSANPLSTAPTPGGTISRVGNAPNVHSSETSCASDSVSWNPTVMSPSTATLANALPPSGFPPASNETFGLNCVTPAVSSTALLSDCASQSGVSNALTSPWRAAALLRKPASTGPLGDCADAATLMSAK